MDKRSGILLVDKFTGMTSHDVVILLRRRLGIKSIGHGGTLDPMATGLLIVLIGEGTKLSQFIANCDKTYEARLVLGTETDSNDKDGTITNTSEINVNESEITAVFGEFKGDIMQTPPYVSAIKHKGKPLYEYSRSGVLIKPAPKTVKVYDLKINKISIPYVEFTLFSSKGFYVRALARDIGARLGCGAHLDYLRRLTIGNFSVDRAIPVNEIGNASIEEIEKRIIPLSDSLSEWVPVVIDNSDLAAVRNANQALIKNLLDKESVTGGKGFKLLDKDSRLVALVRCKGGSDKIEPEILRIFNDN